MRTVDKSGAAFAEAPDAAFYPELVEQGGLYRVLQRIGEERGLDLGDVRPGSDRGLAVYRTAKSDSSRGAIRISTVLNRRAFSIVFDSAVGSYVWAEGSATEPDQVAGVIDSWRGGMLLVPLREAFPFMQFSPMSQGYERGTQVETAWGLLLTGDAHASRRGMLTVLQANSLVSGLFPFFSMGTLRLARDCFDREAGSISIDGQEDGRYSVRSSFDGALLADVELSNLADAVASLI
jgi:hypothetical protein